MLVLGVTRHIAFKRTTKWHSTWICSSRPVAGSRNSVVSAVTIRRAEKPRNRATFLFLDTACCPVPACRPPAFLALHTTCYNLSIVSSSWRWAYKCPKHAEQITRTIKHWVSSSWFSSPHIWIVIQFPAWKLAPTSTKPPTERATDAIS
jgi:hypothetical protein